MDWYNWIFEVTDNCDEIIAWSGFQWGIRSKMNFAPIRHHRSGACTIGQATMVCGQQAVNKRYGYGLRPTPEQRACSLPDCSSHAFKNRKTQTWRGSPDRDMGQSWRVCRGAGEDDGRRERAEELTKVKADGTRLRD
ncbi:unnamed protein product [Toxocara canis]|uniref:SCP domain-containing protein n=1 Tax=Toxocara canis TaxID=6265 RepID=A0A183VE41_TOXCA|nr:unnamed protein product [Toxocara canis]